MYIYGKYCISLREFQTTYHYNDVRMGAIVSQITSLTIVYSTVNMYSGADQRKLQSSASLAFVWGIHRRPVNSPDKWPVARLMFPLDDVIMFAYINAHIWHNELMHNIILLCDQLPQICSCWPMLFLAHSIISQCLPISVVLRGSWEWFSSNLTPIQDDTSILKWNSIPKT